MTPWGKTLAHAPDRMRELRVFQDVPFDPTLSNTEVFAPCCGRRCAADCVVDVRDIPGTIVRGGNRREAQDHDWLCDGCLFLLYADPSSDWTKSMLMEARGAPAALVAEVRTEEVARERIRLLPARVEFDPSAIRRDAAAEIVQAQLEAAESEAFSG